MPASSISSFSNNAWSIMPLSTINTLTVTQLHGMTTQQLSSIINSPDFAQMSSSIRSYATSVVNMNKLVVSSTTTTITTTTLTTTVQTQTTTTNRSSRSVELNLFHICFISTLIFLVY